MIELLRSALEHIAKTAAASRSQTRRIRWIKARAEIALAGREYSDKDVDLPRKVSDSHERLLANRNMLRNGAGYAARRLREGADIEAVARYLDALAATPPASPAPDRP